MEVRDGFASVGAVIDDEAETAFRHAEPAGDFPGLDEQVAEQGVIAGNGGAEAGNDAFRHEQDVGWRLRVNVAKGEALVVLEDDVRRNFPRDDFFEKGHRTTDSMDSAERTIAGSGAF